MVNITGLSIAPDTLVISEWLLLPLLLLGLGMWQHRRCVGPPLTTYSLAQKAGIRSVISKTMINTRYRMQQTGGPNPGLESEKVSPRKWCSNLR